MAASSRYDVTALEHPELADGLQHELESFQLLHAELTARRAFQTHRPQPKRY